MKYFRYLGLMAIVCFSFIYTERIANLTLKKNPIYKEISDKQEIYTIKPINAYIDSIYIIPGLTGKSINVKNSYYNMKSLNAFNSFYLVYDEIIPDISITNNKDKIIKQGNPNKNSVAFIIEYDSKLIDFFHQNNLNASVLIDESQFQKNEVLEQINNETKKFNNLESLLNKYNLNTHICYINDLNKTICEKKGNYLVKTSKIINRGSISDIKNNIASGDIYYISKNTDLLSIKLIINSIMYKDLDIVRLSKLISETRD